MRLIDVDTLKEAHGMKNDCADCDKELRGKSRSCEFERLYTLMDFCGWLDDAPTIEPERKTGQWITQEFGSWAECPECHELYDIPIAHSNFCPNCGVDMRGE